MASKAMDDLAYRARYRSTRKNQYDVRRAATIQNLEGIQRRLAEQRKAA